MISLKISFLDRLKYYQLNFQIVTSLLSRQYSTSDKQQ